LLGLDEKLRRKNPADERINVPMNPKNYWRYRVHLTMEELLREKGFGERVAKMVKENGR